MNSSDFIFSKHLLERMQERSIKADWIYETIDNFEKKVEIAEDEIYFYKSISENENRILKFVVNLQKLLIITAHFDRTIVKKMRT